MKQLVATLFLALIFSSTTSAQDKTAADLYFDQYRGTGTLLSKAEAEEKLRIEAEAEAARIAAEEQAAEEARIAEENKFKLEDIKEFNIDEVIDNIATQPEIEAASQLDEEAKAALEARAREIGKKYPTFFLITFGLIALSIICALICHLILIVRGFEESTPWGLGIFFIPFVGILYCLIRMRFVKLAFTFMLLSGALAAGAVANVVLNKTPEIIEDFESLQELIMEGAEQSQESNESDDTQSDSSEGLESTGTEDAETSAQNSPQTNETPGSQSSRDTSTN